MIDTEMTYQIKSDTAVRDLILKFECQPILFVGSGISQRYIQAPTWRELLKVVFQKLPNKEEYEYYRQKYEDDPIEIGTQLAELVFEWAWTNGREQFPSELFANNVHKDVFLKFLVCEHLKTLSTTPPNLPHHLKKELAAFSEIKPHAIITTNYDLFLESTFDGYETITGQTILRYNTNSFGEIFHIHGDVSHFESIVFTKRDYNDWSDKKKYVSAKLLTYFAEHPVFIMGYSLGDPNVKTLLKDIGELVADENGLIANVYQIIWHHEKIPTNPPEQAVFAVDGKEYRTMAIHTNEFEWVFKALKSQSALKSINPKLVRALAARMMRLVRHDIPSGNVIVNYDTLERVVANEELPSLLGITTTDNPNLSHPFTLTQVASRIGFKKWQDVSKILNKIKDQTGIDLRSSDNRYHIKIKTGTKETSTTRKWSHEAVELFKLVKASKPFELLP